MKKEIASPQKKPPASPLSKSRSLPATSTPPSSASAKTVLSSDVTVPSEEGNEVRSVPPQGAPLCLEGYKIAFSGVMGDMMSRDDIEGLVLQYGGKVGVLCFS